MIILLNQIKRFLYRQIMIALKIKAKNFGSYLSILMSVVTLDFSMNSFISFKRMSPWIQNRDFRLGDLPEGNQMLQTIH